MKLSELGARILLHPQIPKPLHGMNPRSILGKEWWDEHRYKAYAIKDYHCWACGVDKREARYRQWLEGHECYRFDYAGGEARLWGISALCYSCHNYIHKGRLLILQQKGEVDTATYQDILRHGDALIAQVKDDRNPFIINDHDVADWDKWYILIDGKKYYSKFTDMNDWHQHYTGSDLNGEPGEGV